VQAHACTFPAPVQVQTNGFPGEWREAEPILLFPFCDCICPLLSFKQMERSCVTEHDSITGNEREVNSLRQILV